VSPPAPPLPRTGKGSDLISYLGTSLLVAGIGIVGVSSRRPSRVTSARAAQR
jgi:LPXTG-motif cell wall-anchored protein